MKGGKIMADPVSPACRSKRGKGKTQRERARDMVAHAESIPRREEAWKLRVAGNTLSVIAGRLGVTKSTVHGYIAERLAELNQMHSAEQRREHYAMALERAEARLVHWLEQQEKAPLNTKVGNLVLKTLDHIARLNGLVTSNVEVHTHVTLQAPEVLDRVKQVAGRVVSPLVAEKLHQLPAPELEEPHGEA